MASYYVNNTPAGPGLDTNDGLSTATPFLTKGKLDTVKITGDVAYYKGNTGVAYTTSITASSTETTDVDYFIYPSDEGIDPTLYPTWQFTQTANFALTQNGTSFFHKINFTIIQSATSALLAWNYGTSASKYKSFNNCNFSYNNTVNVTSCTISASSGMISQSKCSHNFNGGDYSYNLTPSSGRTTLIDCSFYGNLHSRTTGTCYAIGNTDSIRCSFELETSVTSVSQRRLAVSTGFNIFVNNSIIIKATNGSISAIKLDVNPDTVQTVFDNIIYFHSKVTGVLSAYNGSSPIAAGIPSGTVGNNLVINADNIFSAESAAASTKFADIVSTTNPFISIAPSNINYVKLDAISGTAAKGASIFTNLDLGRFQSLGGGAALLDVFNVKISVDRGDGLLGTYDGSDRWTDPGTAQVELGTAYKANSLTNNRTGTSVGAPFNDLLIDADLKIGVSKLNRNATVNGTYDGSDRHTDPGISNVRTGQAYKSNSLTNNRTGTAAIPVATDVKIGVAIDATIGTYDGSDRHTDPGIAQVELGTVYKSNSLTNNRTGTSVGAPFNDLLSAGDLKTGVSKLNRNATVNGNYDGSDRHTDPGETNVKSGVAYKSNSLINNKTGNRTDAVASNVLTGSGTYGANGTELIPSYSPDFASPANVLTIDTTNNIAGTYLGVASVNVRAGTSFGNSLIGLLNLPPEAVVKIGESYDNGTKTGTLNNTSPGVGNVVGGTTWLLNSVLQTGTRTSIYPVLAAANVLNGVDRGDGVLGTNLSTDPGVANVVAGTNYYINSVLNVGTRLQIYALLDAANVKLDENRGDGILGTYDAQERYTDLPVNKVEDNYLYRYNSLIDNREGELIGGSIDPKFILYPLGTLGQINADNLDISQQIRNQFLTVMEANLTTYKPLDYLEDLSKNSFRQNAKRYGIRQLSLNPIVGSEGVIGREVIERNYEIVLTTDFVNNNTSDEKARASKDAIIETAEQVRRLINNTNFGAFRNARIVRNIVEDTIEIDEANKVVIARISLSIQVKLPRV
jgi:hypothetical protein